jgi:hypothetical protein
MDLDEIIPAKLVRLITALRVRGLDPDLSHYSCMGELIDGLPDTRMNQLLQCGEIAQKDILEVIQPRCPCGQPIERKSFIRHKETLEILCIGCHCYKALTTPEDRKLRCTNCDQPHQNRTTTLCKICRKEAKRLEKESERLRREEQLRIERAEAKQLEIERAKAEHLRQIARTEIKYTEREERFKQYRFEREEHLKQCLSKYETRRELIDIERHVLNNLLDGRAVKKSKAAYDAQFDPFRVGDIIMQTGKYAGLRISMIMYLDANYCWRQIKSQDPTDADELICRYWKDFLKYRSYGTPPLAYSYE